MKIQNPFKAKEPKEYKNQFENQQFNPNKKIVVYEDGEHKVSVPEGTPQEDIESIIATVKSKIKKTL